MAAYDHSFVEHVCFWKQIIHERQDTQDGKKKREKERRKKEGKKYRGWTKKKLEQPIPTSY
jgi:hypothetical protein